MFEVKCLIKPNVFFATTDVDAIFANAVFCYKTFVLEEHFAIKGEIKANQEFYNIKEKDCRHKIGILVIAI